MSDIVDGFKEAQVKISFDHEVISVPGFTHDNCPGLAVTMTFFGAFTVTHIESGMKMCDHYERASSAILVMSQYALIAASKNVSWSDLDSQEAVKMISDASADDVPFDGYTSTSIKGVRKFTVKEWRDSLTNRFFDEFPWEERDPLDDAVQNFNKIEVAA